MVDCSITIVALSFARRLPEFAWHPGSISLTFPEILDSLSHGIGHVSVAQDLGLACPSKRIERRRLHLDRSLNVEAGLRHLFNQAQHAFSGLELTFGTASEAFKLP